MVEALLSERDTAQALLGQSWPAEDVERVETCPVCTCATRSLLYDDAWDASFLVAPGRWSLWRCGECSSAYLDPRPTAASIGRAYERYYTHHDNAGMADPKGPLAMVRRAFANGYRNGRYGGHARPASRLGTLVASFAPEMRTGIDYNFRYLPHPGPSSRVLDVGCGGGEWIAQAEAAGWNACGADPDPISVDRACARGLNVRKGDIATWSDLPGAFDAVTMSHVIEHVDDPRALLTAAFGLLRPGGQLFIDTPNVDAASHARFGRHWRGLETPRHLVLFTRRALDDLLEDIGFRAIVHHRAPGAADFLVAESQRMLALDPDPAPPTRQAPLLPRSETTEFLTLTCTRPASRRSQDWRSGEGRARGSASR